MEVRITVRHADASDDIRKYADEKMSTIDKFSRHTRSIEVVLDSSIFNDDVMFDGICIEVTEMLYQWFDSFPYQRFFLCVWEVYE